MTSRLKTPVIRRTFAMSPEASDGLDTVAECWGWTVTDTHNEAIRRFLAEASEEAPKTKPAR